MSTKARFDLATLSRLQPIFRVQPGMLKYLAAAIILLNFRGWPFAWHFRIYLIAWSVRLRYQIFRLSLLFKSREARRKAELEWLEHLSPVGVNPLRWKESFKTWAGFDDSDFNYHLSNSSYPKNLDMSRFSGSLTINPTLYRCGGWVGLGATHFKFLREIPMLSVYEMRSSIATWDNKWVYVITRFVTRPKAKGKKTAKQLKDTPDPTPTPPTSVAPIGNLHTPSDPKLVQDGVDSPLRRLVAAAEQLDEEDGATLHAIAISECCFKIGRLTIPPALVIAVEGFSAPAPEGQKTYSHENPPSHWAKVRELKPGKDMKKLQAFLKGGWKEVPEKERWWEEAFAGIEEQRKANLELIKGVHDGMEGAKLVRPT